MTEGGAASHPPQPASLIVQDPTGHRLRVELEPVPFRIGRHAENHLVIRDSRASRNHARIVAENGHYILEDGGSRHGTFVNGRRVTRHKLESADRIEFGFPDSYQLTFAHDGAEITRLMEQLAKPESDTIGTGSSPNVGGVGASLGKLRAVLEVARTLQTAFSMQDVLVSVVDAALAITGTERGFLLLRTNGELEIRVARARNGMALAQSDLRVPRRVIRRALEQRRELLSMNFDSDRSTVEHSVADLELRSVICVPLVKIKAGMEEGTNLDAAEHTVGVLYMDSRLVAADLAGGNRELLQTLAIEASTVLENARLLVEERVKQKIEEELNVARTIQQNLLPRSLPDSGWFRASGSSVATHQVGGDYFDVVRVDDECWAVVVADVSGKGVSSALLASLLQGALITASRVAKRLESRLERLNRYMIERTQGEKYATILCGMLEHNGSFEYINAGHCSPILVSTDAQYRYLDTTAMPVGMVEDAQFPSEKTQLRPGDKLVIYSDGVTEAANPAGEFFGKKRLREVVTAHAASSCMAIHDAILETVTGFISSAAQADDITLLVVEYNPELPA